MTTQVCKKKRKKIKLPAEKEHKTGGGSNDIDSQQKRRREIFSNNSMWALKWCRRKGVEWKRAGKKKDRVTGKGGGINKISST